jgi:hypothetical protein
MEYGQGSIIRQRDGSQLLSWVVSGKPLAKAKIVKQDLSLSPVELTGFRKSSGSLPVCLSFEGDAVEEGPGVSRRTNLDSLQGQAGG